MAVGQLCRLSSLANGMCACVRARARACARVHALACWVPNKTEPAIRRSQEAEEEKETKEAEENKEEELGQQQQQQQ
eukprot:COSAG01_NODE_35115_length_536_cov_17.299771_1_plen_76_part_01